MGEEVGLEEGGSDFVGDGVGYRADKEGDRAGFDI